MATRFMMKIVHCGLSLLLLSHGGLELNLEAAQESSTLKVITPEGFLPGQPVLVRVEVLGSDGKPDWSLWDDEVILSTGGNGQTAVPSIIPLHNGRGSALITFSEDVDFSLEISRGEQQVRRNLQSLMGLPMLEVSGALPGDQTTWAGIIHVTGDVTVPEGHQLIIEAGSLVLIDGADSGNDAPGILVNGSIDAQGTESQPIAITCSQPGFNWGQIRHANAALSTYRYTSITRGGRAPGEAHTGTGPVIRSSGSTIIFEQCTISDLTDETGATIGKVMYSISGSDITFDGCILARSRMGPEIDGTALLCTNTHVMNMFGPDDDDAIYIHSQNTGQRALVVDTVVAFMDDDGVDTLQATVDIQNCLIRDVFDKGTSVFGAETRILGTLYVNCGIGVSSKTGNGDTVNTYIRQSTIYARNRGIAAENKNGGSPDAMVHYWVTNTIIRAIDQPQNTIYTDYDPANIQISYSNPGVVWPGMGNQTEDPMFVDAAGHDFGLRPFSPCIDQGDPTFSPDLDGSRSDIGYAPFKVPAPYFSGMKRLDGGGIRFLLHGYTNRLYQIETAETLGGTWDPWATNFLISSPIAVEDNNSSIAPARYYRSRVGP